MKYLLITLTLLTASLLSFAQTIPAVEKSPPVAIDTNIQTHLNSELIKLDIESDPQKNAKTMLAQLERDYSQTQLLQQLIIFSQNPGGERRAWAAVFLTNELTNEMRVDAAMKSVAPMLASTDPKLQQPAKTYALGLCTTQSPKVNFSLIARIVADGRDEKYFPLAKLALDTSPADTLTAFVSYEKEFTQKERNTISVTEKIITCFYAIKLNKFEAPAPIIEATKTEVLQLAADSHWWQRSCAAALITRFPELGTPEIAAKLKQDPHPLIRTLMSPPTPTTFPTKP